MYNECDEYRQNKSEPKVGRCLDTSKDVTEFRKMTNELDKTISILKEEILSLNSMFSAVMRPDKIVESIKNECDKPVMSDIEIWVESMLSIVKSCTSIVREYKNRCVL